jgi:hypothetical protein
MSGNEKRDGAAVELEKKEQKLKYLPESKFDDFEPHKKL